MRLRFLQFLIIVIPISIFGWLFWQELVPSGIFYVRHQVGERSPFIDRILPDQRVLPIEKDANGDVVRPIIGDPAFFFVHPHRGFNKVDVEVWFKNNKAPIVELGGLARVEGQVYDLQPLENLFIDQSKWLRFDQNGLVLLQREKKYESINNFITNLPPRHEIATYRYSLETPFRILGYQHSSIRQSIDVSLRGFHEFKTYIKDEPLFFDFTYMDMNRDEGPDHVQILVYNEEGKLVGDVWVEDDGNISNNAQGSEQKITSIYLPDLSEGVYKIEMRTNRDVFFRKIETTLQKIVFLNNIELGDDVGFLDHPRPVSFWTEAKNIAMQTRHAEGVQEVQVGDKILRITQPYQSFSQVVKADGVIKVMTPEGDLSIQSTGHIAFSPDQFFNPDPVSVGWDFNPDSLDLNYIIAQYRSPDVKNEWKIARVSFDTQLLVQQEGTWKFVFSLPGIRELQQQINIGRINMAWHRDPFTWIDLLVAIKKLAKVE